MKLLIIIVVAVVVGVIAISALITQQNSDVAELSPSSVVELPESMILKNQENLELSLIQCNSIVGDSIIENDADLLLTEINWEYCVNNAIALYGTLEQKELWEYKKQQNPLRLQIDAQLKNAQIQECEEQWSNQTQINKCIQNVNLKFP